MLHQQSQSSLTNLHVNSPQAPSTQVQRVLPQAHLPVCLPHVITAAQSGRAPASLQRPLHGHHQQARPVCQNAQQVQSQQQVSLSQQSAVHSRTFASAHSGQVAAPQVATAPVVSMQSQNHYLHSQHSQMAQPTFAAHQARPVQLPPQAPQAPTGTNGHQVNQQQLSFLLEQAIHALQARQQEPPKAQAPQTLKEQSPRPHTKVSPQVIPKSPESTSVSSDDHHHTQNRSQTSGQNQNQQRRRDLKSSQKKVSIKDESSNKSGRSKHRNEQSLLANDHKRLRLQQASLIELESASEVCRLIPRMPVLFD